MKIWYFSECAYPYLPDPETFDSVRTTLPNSNLDPNRAADLWHRYIDEWQTAEELGFGLMVNEHHGTPTCMNSSGPVIAGILARVTRTAPILFLGNPIANRPDPVRVAEEMALIDIVSRGRLEVGFVRGVPFEVNATNTWPIDMTDRFWEAHDLILEAWTTHDGPFNWSGRFFEHRQVNIWPRPYRQPHPPVWISTLNPASTHPIADRDYTVATFLQGLDGTKAIFDAYRERRRTQGLEVNNDRLAYAGLVFVGDTDEEGRRGAEKLSWYIKANKAPAHFFSPPGYLPVPARVPSLMGTGRGKDQFDGLTMDALIEDGIAMAGDPDTVYEQIRRFYEHVGGVGNLLVMGQAGFLEHDDTVKSMKLFSEEVLPRLRELHGNATLGGVSG